jgi:Hypothetical glycosyl hydrolase family 15
MVDNQTQRPSWVCLTAAVVASVALTTGCGGGGSASTGPVSKAVVTVPLFFDMQGHATVTPAEAEQIGKRSRLVIGTPTQLREIGSALVKLNPNVQVYVYLNSMLSTPNGPTFPPSWYLHDALGRRVQSAKFRAYLMNPLSTSTFDGASGWTNYVSRSCSAILASIHVARGCFLDMLGPAPLSAGYDLNRVAPVAPGTSAAIPASRYLHQTAAVASAVSRYTHRPVAGNGFVSGGAFYGVPTSLLCGSVPIVEAERWLGFKKGSSVTLAVWAMNVQMLIEAQRQGCAVLANYRSSPQNRSQLQDFALASFLLGASPGDLFQFSPHGSGNGPVPAVYTLAIGSPAQTDPKVAMYLQDGVYQRPFTHGRVLVNPTDTTVTVALHGTFRDATGGPLTTAVMPAHSGLLLTKS